MPRSKAIVKVAAVGCSVLLAAGFVSYRAGAFDWLARPEPPPGEPGGESANPSILFDSSKSGRIVPPTAGDQAGPPATSPAILSGSKAPIHLVPPTAPAGSTTPPKAGPPILGGSKSLAPIIPPSQTPNPPK